MYHIISLKHGILTIWPLKSICKPALLNVRVIILVISLCSETAKCDQTDEMRLNVLQKIYVSFGVWKSVTQSSIDYILLLCMLYTKLIIDCEWCYSISRGRRWPCKCMLHTTFSTVDYVKMIELNTVNNIISHYSSNIILTSSDRKQ